MADDSHSELTLGTKPLSSLRVIDLKTELEKRGLPKSGSKKELLERLKRQLQLETLQQKANQNEDQVPNLSLQEDSLVSQNEVVKQYLAGQQKIYELQKEARRKIEQDDAHRASDTEASSSQDEGGGSTKEARDSFPTDETVNHRHTPTDSPKSSSTPQTETVIADTESETNTTHKVTPVVPTPEKDEESRESNTEVQENAEGRDLRKSSEPQVKPGEIESEQTAEEAREDANTEQSTEQVQRSVSPSPDEIEAAKRAELARAVGSICMEREDPIVEEEMEQDCGPNQTGTVEMRDVCEADSVSESQSTVTYGKEDNPVVSDVQNKVGSSSDGVVASEATEVTAEPHVESSEVVDETTEACRMITESYLMEDERKEQAEQGSSESSEVPGSPEKPPVVEKESSSEDEEGEVEHKGSEVERRGSDARKEPKEKEERTQNGTVGDGQKDGHILDLHPGDMEIGYSAARSNDDPVQEREDKQQSPNHVLGDPPPEKNYQPKNISTRKLSLSGSREAKKEEDESGRPQRKRRWGSLAKTSKPTPSISTESLKDLIPDYKPQLSSLSTVAEEAQPKETQISPASVPPLPPPPAGDASEDDSSQDVPEKVAALEKDNVKVEATRGIQVDSRQSSNVGQMSKSTVPPPSTEPVSVPMIPHKAAMAKQQEAEPKAARAPSPAKNPVSRILFIRNLVRPFTLPQLKEMLARTGSLVPDAFWIDKIKSKCYVMYESEEDAVNTRTVLHGSRWPVSNPKTLLVDYSTEDELNFHKQLGESPGLPPPITPPGQVPSIQGRQRVSGVPQKSEEKFSHRLAKNMTVVVSQNVPATNTASGSRSTGSHQHRDDGEKRRASGDSRPNHPVPIREWDRDKLSQEGGHGHHSRHHGKGASMSDGTTDDAPHLTEKDRKDRSSRKEKKEMSKKKVEEPPGKLLDDLFRKTRAMPCIYWLPLTESALAQREMEKKQWEVEREKRREKRQETSLGPEGLGSGERKARPAREALKPLPPPMLTGGNMAPLKGREFSRGRSRSPAGRRR